jgi:hypothetical protein
MRLVLMFPRFSEGKGRKRGRGEEGKRGRGEEGKRGRGEEGKRGRGEEGGGFGGVGARLHRALQRPVVKPGKTITRRASQEPDGRRL